jgi:hypothetical protein
VVIEPPTAVQEDCGDAEAAALDESGRVSQLRRRRPLLRTIVVLVEPPLPCSRVRRLPSGLPPNAQLSAAPLAGVERGTRGGIHAPYQANCVRPTRIGSVKLEAAEEPLSPAEAWELT